MSSSHLMPRWFAGAVAPPDPCACDTFEVADLDLTFFVDADYSGTPWTGIASAGTSGDYKLTNVDPDRTNRAWTVGTAVNGFDPAHADGELQLHIDPLEAMQMTAHLISDDSFAPFSDFADVTALAFWALVKPTTGPDGLKGGRVYFVYNRTIQNVPFYLHVSDGGASFGVQGVIGGVTSCSRNAITMDEWNIVTGRYEGTKLQIGVNEPPGTEPSTDVPYTADLDLSTGDPLQMGMEKFVFHFQDQAFSGDILQAGVATALTDTEFCKIICKARAKYDLALVAP